MSGSNHLLSAVHAGIIQKIAESKSDKDQISQYLCDLIEKGHITPKQLFYYDPEMQVPFLDKLHRAFNPKSSSDYEELIADLIIASAKKMKLAELAALFPGTIYHGKKSLSVPYVNPVALTQKLKEKGGLDAPYLYEFVSGKNEEINTISVKIVGSDVAKTPEKKATSADRKLSQQTAWSAVVASSGHFRRPSKDSKEISQEHEKALADRMKVYEMLKDRVTKYSKSLKEKKSADDQKRITAKLNLITAVAKELESGMPFNGRAYLDTNSSIAKEASTPGFFGENTLIKEIRKINLPKVAPVFKKNAP